MRWRDHDDGWVLDVDEGRYVTVTRSGRGWAVRAYAGGVQRRYFGGFLSDETALRLAEDTLAPRLAAGEYDCGGT